MDERPADAARRALRAAREQQTRTPEGPEDHRKPVPGDPAGAGSRPGDAARDALRRAVNARRGDDTGAQARKLLAHVAGHPEETVTDLARTLATTRAV
ncbi:hypothetical protein ACWDMZ_11265, partial [Streptomyces sp. NPDC000994]